MDRKSIETWLLDTARTPLVVGILNVTPDSFSDGGQFIDPTRAADRGVQMIDDGADWLDIGGESTRPGSQPVSEADQIARVVPVLQEIDARRPGFLTSIDTTRANVAKAALDAGATVINDISAGTDDPQMLRLAADRGCPIVLMHMQGTPATMQANPIYDDVIKDVESFLTARAKAAESAGIAPHRILLDPGLGFGKTIDHNLTLLRETRRLANLGKPLLVGSSRKGFIGTILNEPNAQKRTYGTAATVAYAIANGAGAARVHEVKEMKQVVQVAQAIVGGKFEVRNPKSETDSKHE